MNCCIQQAYVVFSPGADIWNCNSTGVYSGVQSNGNGNYDDTTNLDNTALRGIQQTDDDGVVQFTSIFPGHYTGRATHMVSSNNLPILLS